MGLDMHLYARHYVSGDEVIAKQFPELAKISSKREKSPVVEVVIEAGYWLKANAIHKWFVDNVQDGEDECDAHDVSREQLVELRNLCKTVLETKDSSLLPPQRGFFFGSTDIGEFYWKYLKDTIEIVDDALELSYNRWCFEYQSSW